MSLGDLEEYLSVGENGIKLCIEAMNGKTPKTILDFPSGHGRVLRWMKNQWPEATIYAAEVDADALELVLRFFYTGDCPISLTSAVPLYDASTKLEVPGLAKACETFITQLLHPLTSSIFLEQAITLKMELADMLLQYIRSRFVPALLSVALTRIAVPLTSKI